MLFYISAKYTIWPIVVQTGISFIAVWFALSFACAAVWALIHRKIAIPKIAAAAVLDAQFKYDAQDKRRAETQAKIDAMNATVTNGTENQ